MESASRLMLMLMGMSCYVLVTFLMLFRFGRGEGVVAIVVKLLEDAIRDKDHIYASVSQFSMPLLSFC
jgi:hypothetical protein